MALQRIKAAFYRGGTSKAVMFHREDLPPCSDPFKCPEWDAIFLSVMGSPDSALRQLDGMGGGISSLSKIAIISPSSREDADIDFTFAQVSIDKPVVGYKGNCGNVGSAVGPFALDEGLLSRQGSEAVVRIFNTNTSKLMVASFGIENGLPLTRGDFAIDGVSGAHAPIKLSFIRPDGASTGKLFPTGRPSDVLKIGGRDVEVSMVDVANPLVILHRSALTSALDEFDPALLDDPKHLLFIEEIRVAAAVAMGIAADEQTARTRITNLPLVATVMPSLRYAARGNRIVEARETDIQVQMISMGIPHKATPLTGAMCLAAAAQIPGTVAYRVARKSARNNPEFRIGHPSGVIAMGARCEQRDRQWIVPEAGVFRTARRLFEGSVVIPSL
jgi:2-methylaconitate cis-trans-isomerase PrpF